MGIVDFRHNSSPTAFLDLVSVVKGETWEKLGDGLDDEREATYGPILAEDKFTVIDLMVAMKLWRTAFYYHRRGLYTHRKDLDPNFEREATQKWDFERDRTDAAKSDLVERQRLKALWETLRAASKAGAFAAPLKTRWKFDPKDSLWPSHDAFIDDNDTDAQTQLDTNTDSNRTWSTSYSEDVAKTHSESSN